LKNELLMVTEIEFRNSDRLTRYEFLKGDGYTGEEWTRAQPGGQWRRTKNKVTRRRIDYGLSAYQMLCWNYANPLCTARLRGIAVCSGVGSDMEDRLLTAAREIMFLWLVPTFQTQPTIARGGGTTAAGQTLARYRNVLQPPKAINVARHSYLARFDQRFPRGKTGEGCWVVQIEGLRACSNCPAEDDDGLCLGMDIRRSGMTSDGLDIPVLCCLDSS